MAQQQALNFPTTETTYRLSIYRDGELLARTPETGFDFETNAVHRELVVKGAVAEMAFGTVIEDVTWEPVARPTGWFGWRADPDTGQPAIFELSITKS